MKAGKTWVALLRAINVGGTGKLAMTELTALCKKAGFGGVKTYIQSGNVVFDSDEPKAAVKSTLEAMLAKKLGKPVGVLLRSAAELKRVLDDNPFTDASPSKVIVLFFDRRLPKSSLAEATTPGREELALHGQELYIHYPDGQGRSKLKLPFAAGATGRNLNPIAKLVALAASERG